MIGYRELETILYLFYDKDMHVEGDGIIAH